MNNNPDMGIAALLGSVGCMVMGRKCLEVISSFNLPAEQWPYGDLKIYVLSRSLSEPPPNLHGKVEIYSGDVTALVETLKVDGFEHAYIDGGGTITSCLNH